MKKCLLLSIVCVLSMFFSLNVGAVEIDVVEQNQKVTLSQLQQIREIIGEDYIDKYNACVDAISNQTDNNEVREGLNKILKNYGFKMGDGKVYILQYVSNEYNLYRLVSVDVEE